MMKEAELVVEILGVFHKSETTEEVKSMSPQDCIFIPSNVKVTFD
jgi:hypothetical protein